MKKYSYILAIVLIGVFVLFYSLFAIEMTPQELKELTGEQTFGASVLQPYQGGTGATSFTAGECLVGNGTGAITTGACGAGGGSTFATSSISALLPLSWSVATAQMSIASNAFDIYGQATSTLLSHITTYNHANYDTAYGWGNHAGLYDLLGQATSTKDWLLAQSNTWTGLNTFSSLLNMGNASSTGGISATTFYGALTGTASGNPAETTATIGSLINGSTATTSPSDVDRFAFSFSSVLQYVTWGNIKATLKTYFDTLYGAIAGQVWTGVHDFGGATSLEIPNGAGGTTVDATGEITVDSTSKTFNFYDGTAERVLSPSLYPAFTYATSTWNATTTIPLGVAFVAETWDSAICFTDVGTLNVQFGDGTNNMNLFSASTATSTATLSTNNTFIATEKRYVTIGTPASSPTRVSCTISKKLNP